MFWPGCFWPRPLILGTLLCEPRPTYFLPTGPAYQIEEPVAAMPTRSRSSTDGRSASPAHRLRPHPFRALALPSPSLPLLTPGRRAPPPGEHLGPASAAQRDVQKPRPHREEAAGGDVAVEQEVVWAGLGGVVSVPVGAGRPTQSNVTDTREVETGSDRTGGGAATVTHRNSRLRFHPSAKAWPRWAGPHVTSTFSRSWQTMSTGKTSPAGARQLGP